MAPTPDRRWPGALALGLALALAGAASAEPGTVLKPTELRAQPLFPEYDRPGRAAALDPEKDEEFLRQVRERAEEQRRAYREKRARERAEQEQADGEAGEGS